MGMSTHIQAFIPDTDLLYQKHKKILLMCLENDVSLPKETAQYFGDEYPYETLLEEKLEIDLVQGIHYEEWSDTSSCSGFEVDLTKLPLGVTKLRFLNCW